MIENISLENLSLVFELMTDIFKATVSSSLNEAGDLFEIFDQTVNEHFFSGSYSLHDKFIQTLTFKDAEKLIQIEKTIYLERIGDDFGITNNRDMKGLFFVENNQGKGRVTEKKDTPASNDLIKKPFENIYYLRGFKSTPCMALEKALKGLKNENDYKKDKHADIKTKPDFKSENYFSPLQKRDFLNQVKLAIEFIKEKNTYQSDKSLLRQTDQFLNKFITAKIEELNLYSFFNDNFAKAFKNQTQIIAGNKINEVIPFAIVSYHYKEIDKKNNSKTKKKKKKLLYKKENKYLGNRLFI